MEIGSRAKPAIDESESQPEAPVETGAGRVVNCVAYAEGRRVGDVAIPDISDAIQVPGQFVWIGLYEPTELLLRTLQEEFGLHELAVEDALRAHQRPKVEDYGDSLFAVLRTAQLEGATIVLGETHLFVGPNYVVSIRHGASLSYAEVRGRCENTPQLLGKGPGFVLYAIMDFVVDQYFPIVDTLEDAMEGLEEQIFTATFDSSTTQRIYDLKRDLVNLKRAVAPLLEVCNRLMRYDAALIHEDTRFYYRDVYDHVLRINEATDNLRELLTTALEANLSLIAVRQNEDMKKLAAWAAILAVPTLLAGVYGMNFEYMPELHWHYGYFIAVAAMATVSVLLHAWFRRVGWL